MSRSQPPIPLQTCELQSPSARWSVAGHHRGQLLECQAFTGMQQRRNLAERRLVLQFLPAITDALADER